MLDSRTYEWDLVGTAKTWKKAHNVTHHTYTNVLGKDDDFGYCFSGSRATWRGNRATWSSTWLTLSAGFFDHAVSYYHARPSEYLTAPKGTEERQRRFARCSVTGSPSPGRP